MSLAETIRLWNEGVCATDRKDWTAALDAFTSVQNPPSKLCFNIGCIHLILGNLAEAEQAFARSINRDKHLAVAYFQRGTVFYRRENSEGRAAASSRAEARVWRSPILCSLSTLQVLYNIALLYAKLEDWRKAEEHLTLAISMKTEPRHNKIDRAMEAILGGRCSSDIVIVTASATRKRGRRGEAQENKRSKTKLRKAAALFPADPAIASPSRALEGEPHRVLFEFTPETAEELQVLPGNIVFVLTKGKDNWATVMFNGKKGIVPCNYLEAVELQNQPQVRVSQTVVSHTRRMMLQLTRASVVQLAMFNSTFPLQDAGSATSSPYVLKVHYKYTVAIPVRLGINYSELLDTVCKKLELTPEHTKLRYRPAESEELVTLSEDSMKTVWSHAKDYCLTLWCDVTEGDKDLPRGEDGQAEEGTQKTPPQQLEANHVVARYSYEAIQPEDLEFQAGDVILVLSKGTVRFVGGDIVYKLIHMNEEWLEGQCKGKVGIFPRAFVQKSDAENPEI
uniref:Neutrophil cytosolic factor 2 n=1 Tax=Terrapene triunguis TaxID=2587831 RepID=A0A674I676_9SAUR